MKKENIVFVIALITIIISSIISVYAANYLYNSNEVEYDNEGKNITSTNVQGAIDELYIDANNYSSIDTRVTTLENKNVQIKQILRVSNIPQEATSYSCDWSSYDLLIIEALFYGNVTESYTIPVSYFKSTDSGSRPIITDSIYNRSYEIYKNTSSSVYIYAYQQESNGYGIRIYGVKY